VAAAKATPAGTPPTAQIACIDYVSTLRSLDDAVDPERVFPEILAWLENRSILGWLETATAPGTGFRCLNFIVNWLSGSSAGQAEWARRRRDHVVFQLAQQLLLKCGHGGDDAACPAGPVVDAWDLLCDGYQQGLLRHPGEVAAGAGSGWTLGDFLDALQREVSRVDRLWPRRLSNEIGINCAFIIAESLLPQLGSDECRALLAQIKAAEKVVGCMTSCKCRRLQARIGERIRAAESVPPTEGADHAGGGAEWAAGAPPCK
jgi:hypothetical protein